MALLFIGHHALYLGFELLLHLEELIPAMLQVLRVLTKAPLFAGQLFGGTDEPQSQRFMIRVVERLI